MSLIKLMHNVFGLIEVYFKPYLFTIDIAIMYATKITIPQISFYKIFFERCKVKVYTNPLSFKLFWIILEDLLWITNPKE